MAGPSPSWNTVVVTGRYLTPAGSARVGTVRFTIPVRVVVAPDGDIFPAGGFFTATLDSFGSFSQALPASDDPDTNPTGWTYTVAETFTDGFGGNAQYALAVPLAAAGTGLNLDTVVGIGVTVPGTGALLRGVAGGIAPLNSSGLVTNADGTLPSSGGGLPAGHFGVQINSYGGLYIDTSGG